MTPELLSGLVAGLAGLVTALGAVLGKRATTIRVERDTAEAALAAERKARRVDARRIGRLERALDRAGIPDPDEQETRRANPDNAPRRRRRSAED